MNNIKHNPNDIFEKSYTSSQRMGVITIFLIFGLFGIWSVVAKIDTTITAEGKVINQSYNKVVMHPRGGGVKEIFVKEGDLVKKGDALLRIDNAEERLQLNSNIIKYDTNLFLQCKFKAQSLLNKRLSCGDVVKYLMDSKHLGSFQKENQALFTSEMKQLDAKIDLLKKQNNILMTQNDGLEKQIESQNILLKSYQNELQKWNKLLKSSAIDELKIIQIQRTIEENRLDVGRLYSKIKENLVHATVNKQQIEVEKETFKNNASIKLFELALENRILKDTIGSLKEIIQNATLKSPGDGIVTDMKIHATGEVIPSQSQIMSIVPNDRNLIVEAYVMPSDIEKVYKGLSAEISFPAFINLSAKPIEGKLTYVSADVITSEDGRESYYVVLLDITAKGKSAIKHNGYIIIPGMPAAAYIKIGKKTLMQYLTQPILQMFKGIYNAN